VQQLRRAAQLLHARPDLEVVDVRGNVDTRLAAVTSGRLDAVVLARAGLARLGRLDAVTDTFPPETLLPAPGQGALAIECRSDDDGLRDLLGALEDAGTRRAVTAERAVLAGLHAGCSAPVGALASAAGDALRLRATVGGTVHASAEGTDAEALGHDVARALLERGAGVYLGSTS
jgi:hydroxymethylbilane synthase